MKKFFILTVMALCATNVFAKIILEHDVGLVPGVRIETDVFDKDATVVDFGGGALIGLNCLWEFDREDAVKPYAGISVMFLGNDLDALACGGVDWTFSHGQKADWILRAGGRAGLGLHTFYNNLDVIAELELDVIGMSSKGKGLFGKAGIVLCSSNSPQLYPGFGVQYSGFVGGGLQVGIGYKF